MGFSLEIFFYSSLVKQISLAVNISGLVLFFSCASLTDSFFFFFLIGENGSKVWLWSIGLLKFWVICVLLLLFGALAYGMPRPFASSPLLLLLR